MPKKLAILPYKSTSESAQLLSGILGATLISSHSEIAQNKTAVINWGHGDTPFWYREDMDFLNPPEQVMNSVNKKKTFSMFKRAGVSCPPWTLDDEVAYDWLQKGDWVCCRHRVEGMDGAGLVLAKKPSDFEVAKLYTKFIPDTKEYRVYTFHGGVVDVLQKKPARSDSDPHIRVSSNNWIYVRRNIDTPPGPCLSLAVDATEAVGLDFAGIDMVWNGEKAFALETNTAPDIGEITAEKFAKVFKEWFKEVA